MRTIPKGHVPAYAWPSLYSEITEKVPRSKKAVRAEFIRLLLGNKHRDYLNLVHSMQKQKRRIT